MYLFQLINKFGACALRYFVLSEARPEADVDFSLETFGSRRQSNLADTLGNLLSRATVHFSFEIVEQQEQFIKFYCKICSEQEDVTARSVARTDSV
jgi:methionyl-tRNA synthetase